MPRMLLVAGTLAGGLVLCACTSGAPVAGPPATTSSASLPAETSSTAAAPTAASSTEPSTAGSPTAGSSAGSTTPGTSTAGDPSSAAGFEGVTVIGGGDLKQTPSVHVAPGADPRTLAVQDLITGNGPPATAQDTVSVAYLGALYRTGAVFDSSYGRGSAELSLPNLIPGLAQGISGSTGVPAMKVGGRRLVIVPAALGYPGGAGAIPANSPLVFVVDLQAVS